MSSAMSTDSPVSEVQLLAQAAARAPALWLATALIVEAEPATCRTSQRSILPPVLQLTSLRGNGCMVPCRWRHKRNRQQTNGSDH